MFKVGDIVEFKTWEEMKAEFGLDELGDIKCELAFTQDMEESIERKQYVIERIGLDKRVFLNDNIYYQISTDMLKLVEARELQKLDEWANKQLDPVLCTRHELDMASENYTVYSNIFGALLINSEKIALIKEANYKADPKDVFTYFAQVRNYVFTVCMMSNLKERKDEYREYVSDSGGEIFAWGDFDVYKINNTYLVDCDSCSSALKDNFFIDMITHLHEKYPYTPDNVFDSLVKLDFDTTKLVVSEYAKEILKAKLKGRIKDALTEMEMEMTQSKKSGLERVIKKHKDAIERINRELSDAYMQLRNSQKSLAFYLYGEQHVNESFLDFKNLIESDDSLLDISIYGNTISFYIKQELLYFEDEDWLQVRGNMLASVGKARHLIDAIFTRKARVMLEQGFRMEIGGNTLSSYNERPRYGLPNSHMKEYNCWNENKNKINAYIEEGRWDMAYLQAKSAVAGINVTDTMVLEKFIKYFSKDLYQNIACITDTETGKVMTVAEAIEYYKEKESETHEKD